MVKKGKILSNKDRLILARSILEETHFRLNNLFEITAPEILYSVEQAIDHTKRAIGRLCNKNKQDLVK